MQEPVSDAVTTVSKAARTQRASGTRDAILIAAERLFAEHGVFAVSNRQVSEAAGQGNNAAVGYHFGTKADLIRAIVRKHNDDVERLCQQMVDEVARKADGSVDVRDWVKCLVLPFAQHLTELGSPTWYARFSAQLMPDPAHRDIASKESLASSSVMQIVEGLSRSMPDMAPEVHVERNAMARQLIVQMFAERERALAVGDPTPHTDWDAMAASLVDAISGLMSAPVSPRPKGPEHR